MDEDDSPSSVDAYACCLLIDCWCQCLNGIWCWCDPTAYYAEVDVFLRSFFRACVCCLWMKLLPPLLPIIYTLTPLRALDMVCVYPSANMEREVAFRAAFDRFPYLLCLTSCAFEQFHRHSLPSFLLFDPMRDVLLSLIAKKWIFLQNKVTCNFVVTNRTGARIFKFNDQGSNTLGTRL